MACPLSASERGRGWAVAVSSRTEGREGSPGAAPASVGAGRPAPTAPRARPARRWARATPWCRSRTRPAVRASSAARRWQARPGSRRRSASPARPGPGPGGSARRPGPGSPAWPGPGPAAVRGGPAPCRPGSGRLEAWICRTPSAWIADQPAHDVHDRVDGADLVEVDSLDGRAVDLRLGLGQPPEHGLGAWSRTQGGRSLRSSSATMSARRRSGWTASSTSTSSLVPAIPYDCFGWTSRR